MPFPPMPPVQAVPTGPSMANLAGGSAPPPQMSADGGQTAGAGQVGTQLIQMGAEIDQALKMVAKISPDIAPWVLKTCLELQQQIGQALQKGQLTNLGASDGASFPDGSSRMSGLAG